ncbi:hypothetical protein QN277_021374 [Acacia crassicarpa]|uniref:non-specific serine/threonine protein kinase n=1 Tax=Acacia crassicarpa TaxID=499986 RepID=A0AAE1JRN9_9FABA|nr:hypothetical protein QN277_021374 [Acacia crassicarpa]
MQVLYAHSLRGISSPVFFQLILLFLCSYCAYGFGTMGPISASLGKDEFFCAIDASGKQDVICWGKNNTSSIPPSSSASPSVTDSPPMASLSGGEGFMCGIQASTSQAYCWSATKPTIDLVPPAYQSYAYSQIAAGKNHVCAVRGSYYSNEDSGIVDCWEILRTSDNSLKWKQSDLYYDQSTSNLALNKIVAGEGFSCGAVRDGGLVCWGPTSTSLGVSNVSEKFSILVSGRNSVCGLSNVSGDLKCWGDKDSFADPPDGTGLISLSAGGHYYCGIRADNHIVECWGSFNSSAVPKGSGFMAIASSDYRACGVREEDLLIDCWLVNESSAEFDPPLELSSPGLCSSSSCVPGEFAFNVSNLNEPGLTSLCVRKDLRICSPCGSNCSQGFFLSSPCTENSDRVCTACSLCQNSSCWDVCRHESSPDVVHKKKWHHLLRLLIIIGSAALGFLFIITCGCILPRLITKKEVKSGTAKPEQQADHNIDLHSFPSTTSCPGMPQIFRLCELKDATNGFKEFNELGRGSYGFVYKAVLADGRVVAVKRANAATIIHTNNRDFEMELEILCKIRHCNIVNLLGYCAEMGERLLVYEYMPHGTLYDHLHGGLSPLNWSVRLKIAMQTAKGLEYLHKELAPPIVHKDLKSSNILLDSEWGARISDFGLLTCGDKDQNGDVQSDVYNFGVVLLEILSGRKAYDGDFAPPNIIEWAVPLIKQGKAAAIIDRSVPLPRIVEPLLKLADIAELAVRHNPGERPAMPEIASWLEQIVKDGLIL